MIVWARFYMPPINLWSYPRYAQTYNKLEKRMLNKHIKFAEHWVTVGRPILEVFSGSEEWATLREATNMPINCFGGQDYRIKGDKHWELRRKWIDSDKSLPIEFYNTSDEVWELVKNPYWFQDKTYREQKKEVDTCLPKHRKFRDYWIEIGRPALEIPSVNSWMPCIATPTFGGENYRIKGDYHWELRRKWIDSDRTLRIEGKKEGMDWRILTKHVPIDTTWGLKHFQAEFKYREAQQHENPIPEISRAFKSGYMRGVRDSTDKMKSLIDELYAARGNFG